MNRGRDKKESAGKWILIFDSIHFVMQAEKALKTERLGGEIIPVPRTLSSDCGMAIEFAGSSAMLKKILANSSVKWVKIYRETGGKFTEETF
jgi:hypothetical protein